MNTLLDRAEPEAAEMPFPMVDLCYSRTDKRGVIASGNAAFQRLYGFSWAQLIGAPHHLLRSPDTPRAVFRLMWRILQAGEPCVAYMRNRTLDGRACWVLATVLPLSDGYLSVRIKPTSPLFATAKALYAALTLAERTESVSPEASEQRLLAELARLGHPDYQSFMQAALLAEYRGRSNNPALTAFFGETDKVAASLDSTTKLQIDLMHRFDRLRDLPTNMRIIASRLEPSGGPISAISDIYSATSGELFQEITAFAEGRKSLSRRMQTSFERATFLRVCALLQAEVVLRASGEHIEHAALDRQAESEILGQLRRHYDAQAQTGMIEAEQLAGAMSRASSDLRRSMLGLDTIRVMGRVESGRLGAEGNRIGATIDQIDVCHSGIIGLLQKIMDNAAVVSAGIGAIRSQSKAQGALAA